MLDYTPLVRSYFVKIARRTDVWRYSCRDIQLRQLRFLLKSAANTAFGKAHHFQAILSDDDLYSAYTSAVPRCEYEEIRTLIDRMVRGEKDLLWRGQCFNFAQSSGTSGGKSKYIPITKDSLRLNHYVGGTDAVAHYMRLVPESRLFAGRSLILGGSFANEVTNLPKGVKVGDLSATLIDEINPLANLVRIPSKKVALMAKWEEKLPLMVERAGNADVTNISGVPSWMLVLLQRIMQSKGVATLDEVWPNLEVFFHGGISFEPYRGEYKHIITSSKMHYLETYNASEGFFAVQNDFDDPGMLLLIDAGIFFEFVPLIGGKPLAPWEVEAGKTYEMLISSCNGLWRYSPGDTVTVTSVEPLKIRVAGRTKCFINAFGEELMEWNTERGIAAACDATGASVANYTVAPVYAASGKRGYHQWLIEWHDKPGSMEAFAQTLDKALQGLNSDYQAKRNGDIFLAPLEIVSMPSGSFDNWLLSVGSGKLGGQRKIPRLSNNRNIADALLNSMPPTR
jgi:hypothetical protein